MSRFHSTPNIRLTSSGLLESTVNTEIEEEERRKNYKSNSVMNVRVKTEPLHVPLVNRSHKLQSNTPEYYIENNKSNYIYNNEHNVEEVPRAKSEEKKLIEAKTNSSPTPMRGVLSPIPETSSLHDMLQSYNEECQELASLIAAYTPFKMQHHVKQEDNECAVSHLLLPQYQQEEEQQVSKEHEVALELLVSPMSIETSSTLPTALADKNTKHISSTVHSNQRSSSRFSSANKPLAPPLLHDVDNYESINKNINSSDSNNHNITQRENERLERENKFFEWTKEEKEEKEHKFERNKRNSLTQLQSNAWLTFLLNGCNKIVKHIQQHERSNSTKQQCEEVHELHSSILQKLTLLQSLEVNKQVNNKSERKSSISKSYEGNKVNSSQTSVEVSNSLAAFVALINKIVKALCHSASKQGGVSKSAHSFSSSNNIENSDNDIDSYNSVKHKHKHKTSTRASMSDVMTDNDKLASALVDPSTLRHEALFCAQRAKMENALVLSEERVSVLEIEKEHLLMELDKARKAHEVLQTQNNTLAGQYNLLKKENRTLRIMKNQTANSNASHVKSAKTKKENKQPIRPSLENASSSSSSLSTSSSTSSSLLSDSTAQPEKVIQSQTKSDNAIAILTKELQTVNDENDSMHRTIETLRKTINKHHRILELLMEHYKAAYYYSHYNNTNNNSNHKNSLAKHKLVSPELIAHMLASDTKNV